MMSLIDINHILNSIKGPSIEAPFILPYGPNSI